MTKEHSYALASTRDGPKIDFWTCMHACITHDGPIKSTFGHNA